MARRTASANAMCAAIDAPTPTPDWRCSNPKRSSTGRSDRCNGAVRDSSSFGCELCAIADGYKPKAILTEGFGPDKCKASAMSI